MIVGLVGFIGSGKGTVGEMLVAEGFYTDSFAKPLKDCVAIIFNWDRELLEGNTRESREWRDKPDPYWSKVYGSDFTPRKALQLFGTEACREGLHRDIWCESLGTRVNGIENVVITDVRFKNEVDYIKKIGGKVVRIQRGPDPVWVDTLSDLIFSDARENFMNKFNIHKSEWDWVGCDFDVFIRNDWSLDILRHAVDAAILEK
ncbi:hypothetical protein M0R04_05280 [Candidatus Dojkabacteria bacterium]|jgi:hypothetical protein|nr:hypothetical protein [Candidatus Dojkabacteria bacterium]